MKDSYQPDSFELNDWIAEQFPVEHSIFFYLSDNYAIMLKFWEEKGKPVIWD